MESKYFFESDKVKDFDSFFFLNVKAVWSKRKLTLLFHKKKRNLFLNYHSTEWKKEKYKRKLQQQKMSATVLYLSPESPKPWEYINNYNSKGIEPSNYYHPFRHMFCCVQMQSIYKWFNDYYYCVKCRSNARHACNEMYLIRRKSIFVQNDCSCDLWAVNKLSSVNTHERNIHICIITNTDFFFKSWLSQTHQDKIQK